MTASLFYGGAIAPNLGAFVQVTYDNVARQLHWDNTDIRYAKATTLFGNERSSASPSTTTRP